MSNIALAKAQHSTLKWAKPQEVTFQQALRDEHTGTVNVMTVLR